MTALKPVLPSKFDEQRCRHVAGDTTLVLHCHHFATLISQLANDCSLLDAKKLLAECAEDAFYGVLKDHYAKNNVADLSERVAIAERYFSEIGLGSLKVNYAGLCSGEVALKHSHVDEGWLKKFGESSQPVNHIGCGYATALFSAVFDMPKRHFAAVERKSIACGAGESVITVTDSAGGQQGGN